MDERGRQIHETLDELREELRGAENLDSAARDDLQAAVEEIRSALEAGGSEEPSLLDRLSDFGLRLEGEHPQLAAAIGRVARTLAELGI